MNEISSQTPSETPPQSKDVVSVAKKASRPRPSKKPKISDSKSPEPEVVVADVAHTVAEIKAEWPAPEEASSGGSQSQSDSAKRKRRRRKGKSTSSAPVVFESDASQDGHQLVATPELEAEKPQRESTSFPQPQQAPRSKPSPEFLTKMARKIFLEEIGEEGVALITDQDARDLARRCFRLAEIFVDEQARRR
jgi:hypothetical protein